MLIKNKIKNMNKEEKLKVRLKVDLVVSLASIVGSVTLGTLACFSQTPDVGIYLAATGLGFAVPGVACIGDSIALSLEKEQERQKENMKKAENEFKRDKMNEISEFFIGKKFDELEK